MENQSALNANFTRQDVNEAKIVFYVVLLVLSLAGNVLVIAVVFCNEHLRTCFNYLIVNMAISDLLIPLLAIPMRISLQAGLQPNEWLVSGVLGTILCKVCYFFTDIAVAVSTFTLVAVAFERFFAVIFSMRVQPLNKKKTFIMIVSTWTLSAAIYSPYLYTRKLAKVGTYDQCISSWAPAFNPTTAKTYFLSIATVTIFVIPCISITILYTIIVCKLRQTTKDIVNMLDPRQVLSRHHRDQQVFRLSIVIIVVFYVFWGPLFAYVFVVTFVWKFHIPTYVDSATVLFVVDCLGLVNSSINPFIYFFFQKSYRQGLKTVVHRVFRKTSHEDNLGISMRTFKTSTSTDQRKIRC